jgi:methyl coenzyme M reductase subunit C-like uncharacterized protein (methanogenesis marker protein 7)
MRLVDGDLASVVGLARGAGRDVQLIMMATARGHRLVSAAATEDKG